MPRIIHFELPVDEPERAIKFYQDVFGWKIEKWGGTIDYWLATTGEESEPGINGALAPRSDLLQSTQNSIDVPSVDDFINKVVENGGTALTPKMPIQGVGYFAYCRDTEGNVFGIMENDPSAVV